MSPKSVLGIDAAWTSKEPSGVALVAFQEGRWRCLRVAPSYEAFCKSLQWNDQITGGKPEASKLISTCANLLNQEKPTVVAVDMPLSINPITQRREADNQVSGCYGAKKCAVHSPTPQRPGEISTLMYDGFVKAGYTLAAGLKYPEQALMEVYPHVTLLELMEVDERVPYKASKSKTYWKDATLDERIQLILDQWNAILQRLQKEIDNINLPIPEDARDFTLSSLKRYEDAIDALICAWMGIRYIENGAKPMGDETAAIWVPVQKSLFDNAIAAYEKKFGEFPPLFGWGEDDAIREMQKAVKTGIPMKDPEVPPGALI